MALSVERKRKIFLYGPSGSGKTYSIAPLAGTPDFGEVYIVDIDGGLGTLVNLGVNLEKLHNSAPLATLRDLEDEFNRLRKREGVPEQVKTIVLDSLSAAAFMVSEKVAPSARLDQITPMDQRKWGEFGAIIGKIVRSFLSLPYPNLIVTAHARQHMSGDTVTAVTPALSRNGVDMVNGQFDSVLYRDCTANGKRFWVLDRDGKHEVKTRTPALVTDLGKKTEKELHEFASRL